MLKDNKIFINIASYRDALLPYTIESVLNRAKFPENLVFGVCWQRGEEEVKDLPFDKDQVKVIKVPPLHSKGACWARNLAFQLYDDEEYFWLIDSHILPIKHWDDSLINQYKSTNDLNALLSCAVSQWNPPFGENHWEGDKFKRAVTRATEFYGDILLQMFEVRDNIEKPELNSFLTACNLFGSGRWVRDVEYDPDLFFIGEEISLAVRSFTKGYNHYATTQNMAFHKHDRGYRRVFSDDHYQTVGQLHEINNKRIRRLLMEEGDIDLGIYGLGEKRSLSQYEKYAGVDFKKRYVSERAKTGRPDLNFI